MSATQSRQSIDVEKLVTWAMLDQGLGWSTGRGDSLSGFVALGVRVDTSSIGAPSASLQSDEDALVVQAIIEKLPSEALALIITYGRIGGRPDWCEAGVGGMLQKLDRRGRPMWIYEQPGNKRSPKYPRMEWQGWRQEQVDFDRAAYALWHQSLVELVDPLNEQMKNHTALPPKAPKEPWNMSKAVIHTPDGALNRLRSSPTRPEDRREFVEVEGNYHPLD